MKAKSRKLRISSKSLSAACLLHTSVLICMSSCGGSSSAPSPDFGFSVTPSAVSITVGTYSPTLLLSVSAKDGFSDTVHVSIKGLPPGALSMPSAPLAIPPGGRQVVTLFTPPSTPTGPLSIEFDASSSSLSHNSVLNLTVTPVSNTAVIQETSGQVAADTIELQGVSAGNFNPDYWQNDTLNWVPDVRIPLLAPQTTGPYQNIYAPWPLEQINGWRLFYGGWDGTDTPFDQIYSVTTTDFLNFANRDHIISNGAFLNVNNVNVQQLFDGSLHMICTAAPDQFNTNKPVYFSSPDGIIWNGSPEPYAAQMSDIVNIQGYPGYQSGDFNGSNVLFRDNDQWVLYFLNTKNLSGTNRATGNDPSVFLFQGLALNSPHGLNDVKKFDAGGKSLYVMLRGFNTNVVWYSLSSDGKLFQLEQTLFNNLSTQDRYIVAFAFVTRGNQILGVLYGASAVETLDQNRIFARWLQKKVVITDSSGVQYLGQGSYGPDRQWFQAPASSPLQGTVVVYAEDGVTPLGSSLVNLAAGNAYTLVLK